MAETQTDKHSKEIPDMRLISLLTLGCIAVFLSGCGTPEERAAEHLDAAQEFFDQKEDVSAKLEAANAIQIEPKNVGARYLLALIAERDGNFNEMFQHLLVVIEEEPDMVEARVRLGKLYFGSQAYELATEQLDAAIALAEDDPDVQVLKARILLWQGEKEQSLAALDKAIAADPDHLEAIGNKAVAIHEDQTDEALKLLDDAIGRMPADDEIERLGQLKLDILSRHERTEDLESALLAMIEMGPDDDSKYQGRLIRVYKEQGRMDDAEEMLRDLAASASGDIEAQLNVVQFLAEVRTPEAVAEALQVFIAEDPENQQLKLALGDHYLRNNQADEATVVYEEAAALDPRSENGLLARVKVVAARMRGGETDSATELLASLLADDPAYPRGLLIRAGLRYSEQRFDDTIADLRVLLRKEPSNQEALALMARTYVASGDVVLAKDAYRRLMALNPTLTAPTREFIGLLLQEGDADQAQPIIERILQNDPGNTAAGVLKAELLVLQNDLDGAEAIARGIATGGSDRRGIGSFQLGQVLEQQKRYPEAAEAYSQALEANPDALPILQGLARSMNAQGKQDETIDFLRQRAAGDDNPAIRLMLGGALTDSGKNAEALQVLQSVVDDHPQLSPGYVAVAALYPEDEAKRIEVYRRGLAAIPANLQLSNFLDAEYFRLGQTDARIDLYEDLYAANPGNESIANNLAGLLADYRYEDSASLARAVQMVDALSDTNDPLLMDTVGWVYYRDRNYDQAVQYLERAVAAVSGIPVLHYHLGMAYLGAGDKVGAKQELQKATGSANQDYPGIDEAREALATLSDG